MTLWSAMITNTKLLQRAKKCSITSTIKTRRLSLKGHTLRMDPWNDCQIALMWTPLRKRNVGIPKETWRQIVDKEITEIGWRTLGEAQRQAADLLRWEASRLRPMRHIALTGVVSKQVNFLCIYYL